MLRHLPRTLVPSRRVILTQAQRGGRAWGRYLCYLLFTLKTHQAATEPREDGEEPETPALSLSAALLALTCITVVVAVCSECAASGFQGIQGLAGDARAVAERRAARADLHHGRGRRVLRVRRACQLGLTCACSLPLSVLVSPSTHVMGVCLAAGLLICCLKMVAVRPIPLDACGQLTVHSRYIRLQPLQPHVFRCIKKCLLFRASCMGFGT